MFSQFARDARLGVVVELLIELVLRFFLQFLYSFSRLLIHILVKVLKQPEPSVCNKLFCVVIEL
jgi:hypothetical protein